MPVEFSETDDLNFQEQMSSVRAVISVLSTDIENDMAKLQAVAQEMGAATKLTAVEAGKFFESIGLAGYNAAQIGNELSEFVDMFRRYETIRKIWGCN